ncbi:hypothetical protein [Tateyamaria sp. SN3-11]|uniref:hypothetical protein n=1 Tax=Tateyamaria sp. SN3-11 TaxID=3092147 RepID=UPI0039EC50CD
MNKTNIVDVVMKEWLMAEEAQPVVAEVLQYDDEEESRSALDIIADECYWRDPNDTRYDANRCRFPFASEEEVARVRASISADCEIGDFLKEEV